jgi:hypothetical protein
MAPVRLQHSYLESDSAKVREMLKYFLLTTLSDISTEVVCARLALVCSLLFMFQLSGLRDHGDFDGISRRYLAFALRFNCFR